jgi:hypothetical protein
MLNMGKPKSAEMGLGSAELFTLAEAREKALAARKLLAEGIDPIEHRDGERAKNAMQAAQDAAKAKTFGECATSYIRAHRAGWTNAKHAEQWTNTINTYCAAILTLPVQAVDTGKVLEILEPIWSAKAETARRLRNRMELVLDWAKVKGYRTGDNPARWRGHLDKLLPKLGGKNLLVKHHEALPFSQIGAFVRTLRTQEGLAARALEFLILTAAAPGK